MLRLLAGLAIFIYWLRSLLNQTPEEYEDIWWSVEQDDMW